MCCEDECEIDHSSSVSQMTVDVITQTQIKVSEFHCGLQLVLASRCGYYTELL